MSSFIPQEVIRIKRNGGQLEAKDIADFVSGIVTPEGAPGHVSREQISAMAMAIFWRGMVPEEAAALTLAMRDSGDVMNWAALGLDADAPIVDKHSTGGVGDKVSLMLGPIVAAAGGLVPMISGRGLGHTGGTLDKLESIPGYDAYPDNQRFADIVKDIGCSIIGQTGNLAPADKIFYGVRDVTATVESVPLITASILSKKLSAGLNGLVMDVKFGSGAFMDTFEKAETLAQSIVNVCSAAGTPISALLTDMNEVLGTTAGNAVEVFETIEFLQEPAKADKRLADITLDLAADMLAIVGVEPDVVSARAKADAVWRDGRAADVFARMVVAQGGPADFYEKADKHMPLAPVVRDVLADDTGYVSAVDTRAVGMAVVAMGGGRTNSQAPVDHSVGVTHIAGMGRKLGKGDLLARVIANDDAAADAAAAEIKQAFHLSDQAANSDPIVRKIIRKSV